LAHVGLNSVAIFTPSHVAGGCAAFHRKSPTGGAAKGMPLNIRTLASLLDAPATDPEPVLTGSGIEARETAAIRVPRAGRMRLRFIEMLLGKLIHLTSLAAGTRYRGRKTGLGTPRAPSNGSSSAENSPPEGGGEL
jgi:hypothetical protein